MDGFDDIEDSERAEAEHHSQRLAALRNRMRIISNAATDTPPEEPPPPDPMSRLDHIKADRKANWEAKVPPKFSWAEINALPTELRREAVGWISTRYPTGGNLVLMGPTGSGKSSIGYAISKELYISGSKCKIWSMAALLDEIRPNDTSRTVFESAKNCDLLFIDDLGAEKETEWTEERLYTIIDWRWQYDLPTIVATNFNEEALQTRLSDRIYSRLMHNAEVLIVSGRDFRNTNG